jgi:hypothetical protein
MVSEELKALYLTYRTVYNLLLETVLQGHYPCPSPCAAPDHDTVGSFRVCLVAGQLGQDRPLASSLVPPILRDNRGQHWIVLSQSLTHNQTT